MFRFMINMARVAFVCVTFQLDAGVYETMFKSIKPIASDGTYSDKVRITWKKSDTIQASEYHIYRSSSTAWSKRRRIAIMSRNSTGFSDYSVSRGTKYWYWVCPIYAGLSEKMVVDSTKYDVGYASAPTLKTITPSASDGSYSSSVKVTWSSVSGTYQYYVYRSSSTSWSKRVRIAIMSSSSTSYTDSSVERGVKYWYWVCPVDRLGKIYADSTKYNVGYASAPTLKTIAPSASDGSYSSSVKVTWSSVSGTYQYYVYRSSSTSWSKRTRIAIMSSSSTSYTDSSVERGVKYWYWVCPVDRLGKIYADSTKYNVGYASASTLKTITPSASDGSYSSSVKVTWSSVSGTYQYYVYRSSSTSWSKRVRIAIMSSSSTSYTDSSVERGVKYWYWVCPVDFDGRIYSDSTKYDVGYSKEDSVSSGGVSNDEYANELSYQYCISQYEIYMDKAETQYKSVKSAQERLDKNPLSATLQMSYQSAYNLYKTYVDLAQTWYYKALQYL